MKGTKYSGRSGKDENPGTRGSGLQLLEQIGLELGLWARARPPGLRHMLGRGAKWRSKGLETWGWEGLSVVEWMREEGD